VSHSSAGLRHSTATTVCSPDEEAGDDFSTATAMMNKPLRTICNLPQLEWQPSSHKQHHPIIENRGQRKLLLMEIEFLCNYSRSGDTVLYVGAAPGDHIPLLAGVLFPHLQFILYDPAPYASDIIGYKRLSNVEAHNCLFDDTWADQYRHDIGGSSILFISDIRRVQDNEDLVEDDMRLQARWYELLKPRHAMLKFRPRYGAGNTIYLDGQLLLQPYVSHRSTETRLIVSAQSSNCDSGKDGSSFPYCIYDNLVYEQRMFYLNTQIRNKILGRNGEGDESMPAVPQWDMEVERDILQQYLSWLELRESGACDSLKTIQMLWNEWKLSEKDALETMSEWITTGLHDCKPENDGSKRKADDATDAAGHSLDEPELKRR
jgi:hypothetical protein